MPENFSPNSYKAALARIAMGHHGRLKSGLLPNEIRTNSGHPKPDWELAEDALAAGIDGPNDGQDTARLDFMEQFIVEGVNLESGKTSWLADVDCLRETIDESMRVVSERTHATGSEGSK